MLVQMNFFKNIQYFFNFYIIYIVLQVSLLYASGEMLWYEEQMTNVSGRNASPILIKISILLTEWFQLNSGKIFSIV